MSQCDWCYSFIQEPLFNNIILYIIHKCNIYYIIKYYITVDSSYTRPAVIRELNAVLENIWISSLAQKSVSLVYLLKRANLSRDKAKGIHNVGMYMHHSVSFCIFIVSVRNCINDVHFSKLFMACSYTRVNNSLFSFQMRLLIIGFYTDN